MNNIEEELWNYIDGNCTSLEQEAIALLIERDENYKAKYHELLVLNSELHSLELDEPPMAFTYHVVEGIRKAEALKPLKAAVNKKIIAGIAAFFIITLSALLIYVFAHLNLRAITPTANVAAGINIENMNKDTSKHIIQAVMFLDVVLMLFLFDSFLRRKQASKYMQ